MPIHARIPTIPARGGMRRLLAAAATFALAGTGLILATTPAAAEPGPETRATCSPVNPMGAATPIGSDNGYTLFVRENAILANSELEGTLAVGGTATFGDSRGFQGGQYPIMHGGVGGNADYDVPTIGGEPNRVLLQEFAAVNKIVQVKATGHRSLRRPGRSDLRRQSPSPDRSC